MANTYRVYFNNDNLPEGTRDNEMLSQSLARLRRILLSEIENNGVKGVVILTQGSILQDDDLVKRISSIPILGDVPTGTLELKIKGDPDHPTAVTSEIITYTSGRPAPVLPGILITYLPPKEDLMAFLIIKKGSVKSTRNPNFSPITSVTFRPTEDGDMEMIIEMVKGYVDSDFDRFYKQAIEIMKKGGGMVNDKKYSTGIVKTLNTLGLYRSKIDRGGKSEKEEEIFDPDSIEDNLV